MKKKNRKNKNKNKNNNNAAVVNTRGIKHPCHNGLCEVFNNLFVGKEKDVATGGKDFDVLIPLADLDGRIWDTGFNGDIMYVPISDYDVLPKHIEKKYVKKVTSLVRSGKKVCIFCLGGHGRTGYFTSLVLYELGVKEPIKKLKTKYCSNVVESKKQLQAISDYMKNPSIFEKYQDTVSSYGFGLHTISSYFNNMDYGQYFKTESDKEIESNVAGGLNCGGCLNSYEGVCYDTGKDIKEDDRVCYNFVQRW